MAYYNNKYPRRWLYKAFATEPVTSGLPENLADIYKYVPSETGMSARAKSLKRLNRDIMGYIKIDGTQVDYPFVLDPGDVPANDPYYGPNAYEYDSYYLEKDLFRQYYDRGTIFADCRNVFGSNEFEHSANLVLYGHSWYDGTMFGSLRKYRAGFDFYNQYPFIKVSSNYRDYDYVIFAYLVTSGSYDATDFRYWNMEDLDTEEEFNFYIDCCKRSWGIDTGIDVKFGDKLLTLQKPFYRLRKKKRKLKGLQQSSRSSKALLYNKGDHYEGTDNA